MEPHQPDGTSTAADLDPGARRELHGPAPVGENAGVLFPLATEGFTSPLEVDLGVEDVTGGTPEDYRAALDAMISGLSYINVHTEELSDGEIRGQLVPRE